VNLSTGSSVFCLSELSKNLEGELRLVESEREQCWELDCTTLKTVHQLKLAVASHECDSRMHRRRRAGRRAALRAGDRQPSQQLGDVRDAHQELARSSVRASGPQLAHERSKMRVEVVDDAEQRGDRMPPDLGHAAVGDHVEGAGLPQRGELRGRPTASAARKVRLIDDVRSRIRMRRAAQPLADRAVIQWRRPERRDEVAAGQVGEHARVDTVGLAGQCRD
jgi:hypothetical protein